MIKATLINILIVELTVSINAQANEPILWTFGYQKVGVDTFEIVMTAEIDKGWHLYAMDTAEGGPVPTAFSFKATIGFNLIGQPYPVTQPEVKYDNTYRMDIGIYNKEAEFRQKVIVTQYPVIVKGSITFMSCNDMLCLPPRDVKFAVLIKCISNNEIKHFDKQKDNWSTLLK